MVKTRQTGNIKKNSFELTAWACNTVVVGIDEVGRGCLAGPVVAAAVMLPINKTHRMLKDSKIMTACERAVAFEWIKRHCAYGVGIVHHRAIDKHNIYQATQHAMKKALAHLLVTSVYRPSAIVVDAMPLDFSGTAVADIPVHYFPKGESKSSSIAAASIVAKVIRDTMMKKYDRVIPGYSLLDNKGYGTAVHQKALHKHHHSIIHRVRFLSKLLEDTNRDEQAELFCRSD
jgi:ribonuclease HII